MSMKENERKLLTELHSAWTNRDLRRYDALMSSTVDRHRGGHNLVPIFVNALRYEPSTFGLVASAVLARLNDPFSVDLLIENLTPDDPEARYWAAHVLGVLRDPKAVRPLIERLDDVATRVRERAAQALANLEVYGEHPRLSAALYDENPRVRVYIAGVFANRGDNRALPVLIDLVESELNTVRSAAAEFLGNLGDPAAIPALLKAIQRCTEDPRISRREMSNAALKFDDRRLVHPVLALYADDDDVVSTMHLHEWLGRMGDPAAIPVLIRALRHPIACSNAINALIRAPFTHDPRVTEALTDLLSPNAVVRLDTDQLQRIRQALADTSNLPVDDRLLLISKLGDRWATTRGWAARELGKLGDLRAVEPLIGLLKDEICFGDAAWALGQLGASEALEPLIDIVRRDDRGGDSILALDAIAAIGNPHVFGTLLDLLPINPYRIEDLLWKLLDEQAFPVLISSLTHEDKEVSQFSARALGILGDGLAIPHLTRVLANKESEARGEAFFALAELDRDSLPHLGSDWMADSHLRAQVVWVTLMGDGPLSKAMHESLAAQLVIAGNLCMMVAIAEVASRIPNDPMVSGFLTGLEETLGILPTAQIELNPQAGGRKLSNRSNLITGTISNKGLGPAFYVTVRLYESGVEDSKSAVFEATLLWPGESHTWETTWVHDLAGTVRLVWDIEFVHITGLVRVKKTGIIDVDDPNFTPPIVVSIGGDYTGDIITDRGIKQGDDGILQVKDAGGGIPEITFCTHCGGELNRAAGARYCPFCGAAIMA